MEVKRIDDITTDVKLNNKREGFVIEQIRFFGREPYKESSLYTYFRFKRSFKDTCKYLGF